MPDLGDDMKKEPTPKNPYPYCLCGCGWENNPGSRFKSGDDGKLKFLLNQIERGEQGADALPDELIAASMNDHKFKVLKKYTAEDILRLAGDRTTRKNWTMQRGEIWQVSPPEPSSFGPGYAGLVLIIQDNQFNASRISTAVVAVVTSNPNLCETEGNVFLCIGGAGLSENSVVNVSQILTIDKALFTERVGLLPPETMAAVDGGLRLGLGL